MKLVVKDNKKKWTNSFVVDPQRKNICIDKWRGIFDRLKTKKRSILPVVISQKIGCMGGRNGSRIERNRTF